MLNSMKFRRSSGFSLIELMLAMLIGLIIMGGVMQVYVSTQDTQRSSDDQLALLADARFAMETIAYDLRHTGIWGRHNNPGVIACQKTDALAYPCPEGINAEMPLATFDCANEEYIYLERPLFAEDNDNPYAETCASESYKAGTDVLTVRYADTSELVDEVLAKDIAYLRTSLKVGMLFIGPTFPSPTDYDELADEAILAERRYTNHLLISRAYYVSDYTDVAGDGLPSLRRADLVAGPAMKSQVLLIGVEDFQLEFGVDVAIDGVPAGRGDGQVDRYVNASNVTNWSNGEVVAVRMWVLMRSERKDRDNIGSAQTFNYAGKTVTTPNDGYRRHLVSSVVKLRNTFQIDKMVAGE